MVLELSSSQGSQGVASRIGLRRFERCGGVRGRGDYSPQIIEKHYSQWIHARLESINTAVKATW